MKKLLLLSIAWIILLLNQSVFAYSPVAADINLWYELSERLIERLQQSKWNTNTYNALEQWLANAKVRIAANERYSYIFQLTSDTVYDINKKVENDAYFALTKKFRQNHSVTMQSEYGQPTNLSQCFKHYPMIDEYARKTNKPTPLILAMRYIESSCGMYNPANRDWLFQIINNDYEPWIIDRASLLSQLEDFAKFMDNKWNWYYSRNPNAPRELWYTSFTYDALQTFAALYNWYDLESGIRNYPLKGGNSYYFLGNYNEEYKGKRDWLLVFFLKLSKLEAEYFGK